MQGQEQEMEVDVDVAQATEASNLLQLIKQLLVEKAYDGVRMLFQSAQEAERNIRLLAHIAMDLYLQHYARWLPGECQTNRFQLTERIQAAKMANVRCLHKLIRLQKLLLPLSK